MLHNITPPPVHSGDAVALAVDQPRNGGFPWPYADRTPSFTSVSIKPHRMLPGAVPTVWVKPRNSNDRLFRLTLGVIVATVAVIAVYLWARA